MVKFYQGQSIPTTETLSEGGLYFNTDAKKVYLNNNSSIEEFDCSRHNVLYDPSGNVGITLDDKNNVTQLGVNNQDGVPSTNPNGININDSTNTIVFGDSNINTSLLSTKVSLTTLQNDYSLTNEIAHDGKDGGVSNLVAGSCNRTDRSFSIIAGCWNVNTGNGHDSIITGLHNINGAQYSLVAGRENKVGTLNGAEAKQGGVLVVGRNNTVNGQHSVTSGANNINNHRYSNAFGTGLTTSNNYHTVVGRYNKTLSSEIFSVGTGSSATATRTAFMIDSGSSIHTDAKNVTVKASGDVSISGNATCIGTGLEASTSNQVVVGRYNEKSAGDCVFIVGNGTKEKPHTLLAMQSNGTSYLYGKLLVNSDLISNTNLTIKGKVTLPDSYAEPDTFITTDGNKTYWSGYKPSNCVVFKEQERLEAYVYSVRRLNYYANSGDEPETHYILNMTLSECSPTFDTLNTFSFDGSINTSSTSVLIHNGQCEELTINKLSNPTYGECEITTWPFTWGDSSPVIVHTDNLDAGWYDAYLTTSPYMTIGLDKPSNVLTYLNLDKVDNTHDYEKNVNYAEASTKATQDGNGNVITDTYLPLSGGTMTGALRVDAPIVAYNYTNNMTAPAVIFDKSGSYCTGIGSAGPEEPDTILFAPVDNSNWYLDHKQKWKFHGDVIADTVTADTIQWKDNDSIHDIGSYAMKRGTYQRIEGTETTHLDLNNYIQAGFYNVKTQYVDNCPSGIGIDAVLLVYGWDSPGYELQEITETGASSSTRRWIRKRYENNWSAWKAIISEDNISSQSVNYATSAGSAPASDVPSWAKQSLKPSYSYSEITDRPIYVAEIYYKDGALTMLMSDGYEQDVRTITTGTGGGLAFFVDSSRYTSASALYWYDYNTDPDNTAGIYAEDPGYVLLDGRYLTYTNGSFVNYDDEIIDGYHYSTTSQ